MKGRLRRSLSVFVHSGVHTELGGGARAGWLQPDNEPSARRAPNCMSATCAPRGFPGFLNNFVERNLAKKTQVEYEEEVVERPIITTKIVPKYIEVRIDDGTLNQIVKAMVKIHLWNSRIPNLTINRHPLFSNSWKNEKKTYSNPSQVPQIQKRFKEILVEKTVEEIIEIPKIEYVEEVVERHVPRGVKYVPKYVEVRKPYYVPKDVEVRGN
jgi:hypothetical protein